MLTTTSIKFSWHAGSVLTASYDVYGSKASSGRDLAVGNWTILQSSNDTSYTATDLASGTTYIFSVHSLNANGNDLNHVEYSFQTQALAGQGQLPPGCACALRPTVGALAPGHAHGAYQGPPAPRFACPPPFPAAVPVSAGLLGGVAAAVVAVILSMIIGFVVYRRRSEKQRKKLLQDYSDQLQMVRPRVLGDCKRPTFLSQARTDSRVVDVRETGLRAPRS